LRDLVDELLHAKVRARLFGAGEMPRLGRLVLEERLGGGATGTVFAAYDPRLERRVAVKVLHEADARVLAEARALAKLAHPNVVAVHDADELDGVAFIVMELVDGVSLRAWIAEPRPWREVARVMREAAEGVAAAHAAGLVHRDLKPDNILIGRDRVRVGDFGPDAATPLYSAPEGNVDARSDQFSFGVTFHEALHGVRPPGTSRRVPGWLARVLARATDPVPAARFPSMTALRVALNRPRRTALVAIAGAALAVSTVMVALAYRQPGDPCDGGRKLGQVWNPDVSAAVRAGLGNAAWSSETVSALDDVAHRWRISYHEVCTTTRSDALLAARMRCLDRARARLGALATAMAGKLDGQERIAAPGAVGELPRSEDCERLAVADASGDPAIDKALAAAWAAYELGHYKQAREQVAAVKPTAARQRASGLVLGSAIDTRIGDPAAARKELDDALVAAADAKAPDLEYEVWLRRLRNELFAGDPTKVFEWESFARAAASRAGRQGAELDGIFGEALRDAGQYAKAKEVLERALASDDPLRPEQRAVLEMNLGSTQLALGDADTAQNTLSHARDRVVSARGDRHPDLALYDDKLAAADRARGKLRDAMKLHARSLELREAAFGPDDRSIATSLYQRALTETEGGDIAKAFADLQRALAIRTKVYGVNSPRLGELYLALSETVAAARYVPAWVEGDAAALRAKAVELDRRLDRTEPPHDPDPSKLSDEPTRTALRVYIALARAGNVQAARTAISLYQALPELERGAYDEMWAITRGESAAHATDER
jgi:tetratricopeptide (TPR) repeat protein